MPNPIVPPRTQVASRLPEFMAKFDKLSELSTQAKATRQSFDTLAAKADMVSLDDVIDEAAKVVSKGVDPKAVATVLASAPQSGNSGELQKWVAVQDAQFQHSEHMIDLLHRVAAHDMGVEAMRELARNDLSGEQNA